METYGKILLIAMPAFLLLVLAEKYYGLYRKQDTVRNMDMIASMSSGVTNVTKDVLGLSITLIGYGWLVEHIAIMHVRATFLVYFIAFVALDFAGYWVHRLSHEINIFWNKHLVHHSSEEFNLACALRQSISTFFNIFTIFLVPAALLGVPEKVIAVVAPLHLFAQFWYHTQHIGRMGFFEKIIVTPSHHRVHHAINKEYIDKNHGQILIIWDKLFGTFQEELPRVKPVYGITRPVRTWNPITINFQHLALLIRDAWRTASWKDRFRIWFMPTGWRPADVASQYPVQKIEDVYNFERYEPKTSKQLLGWSWMQLIVLLLLVSYLFGNIARIGSPAIFYYGAFIFLYVYAYTELMNRNPYALAWEFCKVCAGAAIIFYSGDWFLATPIFPWIKTAMLIYFMLSIAVTSWFVLHHFRDQPMHASSLQR